MSIAVGFGNDVLRNRVSDVCVHNEINEAGDLGEWGAEGTEIPFKSPVDGHVRRSMGTIDSGSVEHVCAKAELPAVRARLRELANEHRRFGYRRLFIMLRREGEASGINRIYWLYREEGLGVRRRKGRKRAVGVRAPILVEARPNARWSLDFVQGVSGILCAGP